MLEWDGVKVGPGTLSMFKSGTPGPPSKFKSGTLGPLSKFKSGTLIKIFFHFALLDLHVMEIIFHE